MKKETIDTLLMRGDSNTWWKAVVNKHGRLANEVDNRIRATNTTKLIRKEEVPKGRTVIYAHFLCDYRPLKLELYRIRRTVIGDRL